MSKYVATRTFSGQFDMVYKGQIVTESMYNFNELYEQGFIGHVEEKEPDEIEVVKSEGKPNKKTRKK